MGTCRAVVAALGFAAMFAGCSRQTSPLPRPVTTAVVCVLRQPWEGVDRLAASDIVHVWYRTGAMEGASEGNEGAGTYNVVVTEPGDHDGLLLLADTENAGGRITVARNTYRLKNVNGEWLASGGNGGPATYRAVGTYATRLVHSGTPTALSWKNVEEPQCTFEP